MSAVPAEIKEIKETENNVSQISLDVSLNRFRRPTHIDFDDAAREQEENYAFHFCTDVADIPAPSSITPLRRGFRAIWNLEKPIDPKEARQIHMALHVACLFPGPVLINRDVPIPGESPKDRRMRLVNTPRIHKKRENYIYCGNVNNLEALRSFVKSWEPKEEPKKKTCKEKIHVQPNVNIEVGDWLFDPLLYHKPRNTWTCLAYYDKKGNWKQKWVKTYELHKTLQELDLNKDWWISQNEFSAKKRDFEHVSYMQVNYIDLDWEDPHKCALWARGALPPARDTDGCRDIILARCNALHIPAPSIITFSGNGFHLKWIYADGAIPKRAFPRWITVQEHLIAQFRDFGADPAAKDASRVLRLAGSKNMKEHTVDRDVRVIHHIPVQHSFNYYANAILPFTQQEVKEYKAAKAAAKAEKEAQTEKNKEKEKENKKKAQKGKLPVGIGWAKMAHRRYQDILKLIELRRDEWGNVHKGSRELMVFWGMVCLCQAGLVTPGNFSSYQDDLISKMGGGFTCADASTLRGQLQSTVDGDRWKEWKGQTVSKIYNIKTETLIDKLHITPEEQKVLDVLISKNEKRCRRYARQREEHQSREQYLAEHTQEREKKWEKDGVSRSTYFRRKKKEKEAEAAALAEEERLIAEEAERRKEEERIERKLRAQERRKEFWESPRGQRIIAEKKAEREKNSPKWQENIAKHAPFVGMEESDLTEINEIFDEMLKSAWDTYAAEQANKVTPMYVSRQKRKELAAQRAKERELEKARNEEAHRAQEEELTSLLGGIGSGCWEWAPPKNEDHNEHEIEHDIWISESIRDMNEANENEECECG